MIGALITSKTRIKLLLKFFLNPDNSAYLRGLSDEFGESTNSIRLELNRLEDANMLHSEFEGNKKVFKVNKLHPFYSDVNQIVRKYLGIDVIVSNILKGLGTPQFLYLTGDLARGKESNLIDLVLVGDINQTYLIGVVEKTEKLISRKIRYLIYSEEEFKNNQIEKNNLLLIWSREL
ncbi:ArsR family transcriptional regulator [Flavobacteriales bacterium]|nr:ArsR family transcriptional regulator [Flavobacteriales bacterium]